LRDLRNQADYDLSPAFTQHLANTATDAARQIIQALTLPTVEPTRTQVRDAIIAYERIAYGQTTWSQPPP
jgi:hypothetical protein